ncbi:hypothetical protein IM543_11340 [Massilia sp. UMI-21]|nr:hypothetical protein IM543_11340 [Massilia sp. UMI-21]
MKTNREKYDHYCSLIAARDAEAIEALLPDGVPAQIFIIEQYEAKPIAVTGVRRCRPRLYVKSEPSRITRGDVEAAKAAAEGWVAPTLDEIFVDYNYKQTYGTVSGAYPYPKIGAEITLAWSAESLAPEIERRRALYAPRDGHKPCAYCRTQTPEAKLVSGTIHYRDRGGLARKTCLYCSPTCHGYDQCGHEG